MLTFTMVGFREDPVELGICCKSMLARYTQNYRHNFITKERSELQPEVEGNPVLEVSRATVRVQPHLEKVLLSKNLVKSSIYLCEVLRYKGFEEFHKVNEALLEEQ